MKKYILILVIIGIAFGTGLFLGGSCDMKKVDPAFMDHKHDMKDSADKKKTEVWTCSMHPSIRMPGPGKCPICGMTLILATGENNEVEGKRSLTLSPSAIKLAEIRTEAVVRKYIPVNVRMVGKVDFDETRLKNITSWVSGRLDRLYVDYTGVPVKKGDHMVYMYSPDLLTAQEELLQAIQAEKNLKASGMEIMKKTARNTVTSVREKLRLLGLTQDQIQNIEDSRKVMDHMTIYAPIGGIVIQKKVDEGMYVNTGTLLYSIADLTRLWVRLDAYESDLIWVRYGQKVDIETEAYPGEAFKGIISFIDPVLNSQTRTVKIRVNVLNEDGRLKPGMFVHAIAHSRVAESGKVMDSALAGKWICPMHPEVIRNEAGNCNICGMPLARTETLGYASMSEKTKDTPPLVIPASAPLITGKRAVVYVADKNIKGSFEGREVVLGPRAGDYYLVEQGLREGEVVVTNGNFKIDSSMQLSAKPSMMNPEGGGVPPSGHVHHEGMNMAKDSARSGSDKQKDEKYNSPLKFRNQIDNVLGVYFKIQQFLSLDDTKAASMEGNAMEKALNDVDMSLLEGEEHMAWMNDAGGLLKQAAIISKTQDIVKQRESFYLLSEALTSVVKRFGTGGTQAVIQYHCPMAFAGRGAHWLQNKNETSNPYFGQAMSKCGEKIAVLVPLK